MSVRHTTLYLPGLIFQTGVARIFKFATRGFAYDLFSRGFIFSFATRGSAFEFAERGVIFTMPTRGTTWTVDKR